MSVYFMAQIRMVDEDVYRKYLERCDEVFSKYNGRYLAVDSAPERLEGEWDYSRSVLIEFPCREDFDRWYHSHDYQAILKYRLSGAVCDSILVHGKEDNK